MAFVLSASDEAKEEGSFSWMVRSPLTGSAWAAVSLCPMCLGKGLLGVAELRLPGLAVRGAFASWGEQGWAPCPSRREGRGSDSFTVSWGGSHLLLP